MGTRLQWADRGPYRSVLYKIDDDSCVNKKVAEVTYDHNEGTFVSLIFNLDDYKAPIRYAQINIASKTEAMEAALAMLVANRFAQSS